MPGSIASERQKKFLQDLFVESELAPSMKRSEQCSVNMHGQCYLKHKRWGDGQHPDEEDLLGIAVGETRGGEPIAHFHVTWSQLHWARIDAQPNRRIGTEWRVRICRDREISTEEIYFWAPKGKPIEDLKTKWPADSAGWIAF
jgi:hypothetical protein